MPSEPKDIKELADPDRSSTPPLVELTLDVKGVPMKGMVPRWVVQHIIDLLRSNTETIERSMADAKHHGKTAASINWFAGFGLGAMLAAYASHRFPASAEYIWLGGMGLSLSMSILSVIRAKRRIAEIDGRIKRTTSNETK